MPNCAVVVGINYISPAPTSPSGMIAPLRFAEADAQAMAQELTIIGYEVSLLLGIQATRLAIIEALLQQVQRTSASGLLIFYFAGHADVDSNEQNTAYILPIDADLDNLVATTISLEDLSTQYLGNASSILTLLDCSHSGYAVGLR